MLRIFLIIAVVAGLAGLFGAYQAGEKIKTITSERNDAQEKAKVAQTAETKAKSEAKKAKDEADKAKSALATTTENLKTTTARAEQQEKRANDLETKLTKSEQDRVTAQQQLAAWNALSIPVDQVRNLQVELRKTVEERDAFAEEKKILVRNLTVVQAELDKFKGKDAEVKLPAGLKGKVLAVDTKYEFVVLDVGSNQGVLERGKMAVSRDGKLVAKLKIYSTEPNRSIANIMRDWRQLEVKEGDTVFTSYEALDHP
jgi:hypothetical protein